MDGKQSYHSGNTQFYSCGSLEEQEGYLDQLNLSHGSINQSVGTVTQRANAASKTYWTRVFAPDDATDTMLEASTNKPGIYCLNDDMYLNDELILQSEHDPDDLAEPVFEPKRFNQLNQPLTVDLYRMDKLQLEKQAAKANAVKRQLLGQALVEDQEFMLKNPDGAVTDKRLDTLVQKRNPRPRLPKETFWKMGSDDYGIGRVRKRKHLCDLCPRDLEAIVTSVNEDFLTFKATADLHGVKPALVQKIISDLKKDENFITKRKQKLIGKEERVEQVKRYVAALYGQR